MLSRMSVVAFSIALIVMAALVWAPTPAASQDAPAAIVNLGLPDPTVYADYVENPLVTAGQITTAGAARQTQLSVRLSF